MAKLWGGRFAKSTASLTDQFNASIEVDQKLYKQDILGSIAHGKMLGKQGILTESEVEIIVKGLEQILKDIEAGEVTFKIEYEDIHMNIEALLTDSIGALGKKLHTARSRNDQVALDIRLYLRDEIKKIMDQIQGLLRVLHELAKKNQETIMPSYTHLQRAQPVTFAFYLLAYVQMFKRDYERLEDCYKRTNQLPLGSGALAGTTYDTDRDYLAELLGFDGVCENAMDAVSDRDFAIEFANCGAILMMHLSRFCEELIIWNSSEFSFITMDDAYSTGSSIMPQKKNPDIAELVRGKTGRIYGNLNTLLVLMKSLPLAYNKDMQEDKEPVFDTVEQVSLCLEIFTKMIETITVNKEIMLEATKKGFLNATDAADYLVSKGLPFRECHHVIGSMVLYCETNGLTLEEVSLEQLKTFSPLFESDIYDKISIRSCIENKKSKGSTSFDSVKEQLKKNKFV